jgi:hypothetical protein
MAYQFINELLSTLDALGRTIKKINFTMQELLSDERSVMCEREVQISFNFRSFILTENFILFSFLPADL